LSTDIAAPLRHIAIGMMAESLEDLVKRSLLRALFPGVAVLLGCGRDHDPTREPGREKSVSPHYKPEYGERE
jgi:hypothetical protein